MTDRVRALLITDEGKLLTIKRTRPGQDPYWVLPGGGVEDGETLLDALARELREELAATVDIHGLLHVLSRPGENQYFYLARVRTWSFDDRSGPEFTDPARGQYHLEQIPLSADSISSPGARRVSLGEHPLRTARQAPAGGRRPGRVLSRRQPGEQPDHRGSRRLSACVSPLGEDLAGAPDDERRRPR